jgi:hypothetical protein
MGADRVLPPGDHGLGHGDERLQGPARDDRVRLADLLGGEGPQRHAEPLGDGEQDVAAALAGDLVDAGEPEARLVELGHQPVVERGVERARERDERLAAQVRWAEHLPLAERVPPQQHRGERLARDERLHLDALVPAGIVHEPEVELTRAQAAAAAPW